MSQWRVLWRAVTKNRRSIVATVVLMAGAIVLMELVMVHGYKFGLQWGPDRRLELAPAGLSQAPAASIVPRP